MHATSIQTQNRKVTDFKFFFLIWMNTYIIIIITVHIQFFLNFSLDTRPYKQTCRFKQNRV